jgi:predicted secreted Zn-dependent protease
LPDLFGGEERVKNPSQIFRRDAGAAVTNNNADASCDSLRLNSKQCAQSVVIFNDFSRMFDLVLREIKKTEV